MRIICVFFVFLANVSVTMSFERNHFRFYVIFVSTNIVVSVNVGSIIFVSVIVSITEISLIPACMYVGVGCSVMFRDLAADPK